MSVLDELDDEEWDLVERSDPPSSTSPMLATLTHDHFSDDAWLFERKFDGERTVVRREGAGARLMSRNDKVLDDSYPELVEAFGDQSADDFVVDGEIVAFDGNVTSFSRLQGRMQKDDPDEARATGIAVFCYLFDVTHVDGHDVTRLPLRRRKSLLRNLIEWEDPVRYTQHRNADGDRTTPRPARRAGRA